MGSSKKRKTPRSQQQEAKAKKLFLCLVSGHEASEEGDRFFSFQVLLPADDPDDIADILIEHFKSQRRDKILFDKDSSFDIYLDHIYEFVGPVVAPLVINYCSSEGSDHSEVGNYAPDDIDGVLVGYGWTPDDAPPDESDGPQIMKPLMTFNTADGRSMKDFYAVHNAPARRIREKLSGCGWRDASSKKGLKLKLERKSIHLEVSSTQETMKGGFDVVITHREKSAKFPSLKYLVAYEGRLDRVLDAMADMSRDIEDWNVRDCLRELHRAANEMYVYADSKPVALRELGERF